MPPTRLTVPFAVLLIAALTAFALNARSDFMGQSIENDFPQEISEAKSKGKRLVIMFHQLGCPYCDKMRTRVFPEAKVDAFYSKNFVMLESNIKGNLDVVTPDGEKSTEVKMAQKYRIRATPVFMFFDTDGKLALKLTGFLDADMFVRAGNYVTESVHKRPDNISFYRYLKGGS
ncbi:MAG: thioredoxin family protein [Rhodospirillaceae bacterium]